MIGRVSVFEIEPLRDTNEETYGIRNHYSKVASSNVDRKAAAKNS
jgi:hypothetical protein